MLHFFVFSYINTIRLPIYGNLAPETVRRLANLPSGRQEIPVIMFKPQQSRQKTIYSRLKTHQKTGLYVLKNIFGGGKILTETEKELHSPSALIRGLIFEEC